MRPPASPLLVTCALSLGLGAAQAAAAPAKLPQIDFRDRTLANGLRVLSVEDHSSPTVSINVWYHVGSKDDPEGRSGFAHLFEHIMFKATKHMKDEEMDRLTEDVGGSNNAFTADDMTVYYEIVPSNYLETLLWAEAERMSALGVNEANFRSERDVVEEEFRQSYLANPYGRLELEIEKKSWAVHPYKRPGIGNIDELEAATLEDVTKFHATYYRPDNATLVVVGDFEPDRLDAWVDKYFGQIPRPAAPIPRVSVEEPRRKAEQRFDVTAPNVPLPAVVYTYLAPREADADAPALTVAEAVLGDGESSRLYQSLVYQRRVASEAEASADLREDAGLVVFTVILAGGREPGEAEAALDEEIRRIREEPVDAAELDKAKNVLVTRKLRELETNNGKAEALGHAAVVLGDASRVNTDVAKLEAVTAADVQRVMRQYLDPATRVAIVYRNAPRATRAGRGARP